MDNEVFRTCNGFIGQNGYCLECGQLAGQSGNYCGRLIPALPPSQERSSEDARKEAEEIFGGLRELIKDDAIYHWYIDLIVQYRLDGGS